MRALIYSFLRPNPTLSPNCTAPGPRRERSRPLRAGSDRIELDCVPQTSHALKHTENQLVATYDEIKRQLRIKQRLEGELRLRCVAVEVLRVPTAEEYSECPQ